MKSLAPNTLLQNRYLVVQLIGKGGMGEVYLAVDQRLGSAIALKRTFFTDDEMLGSAFEREARTLARLRHPVLPKVSDHFIEDGNQYLVMDHISGDDLSKRLESAKKPFPLNWVLFWADQLLDALHYLHSHNPPIVHRDIKPQNLKLTDDNHIVLLDFGLAKDNVGNTRVTSAGSVVGFTPHYAPMEQIRGVGTNPKSDLYSLSATLYQLLTNTVPADALSRADILLGKMPDPLIPVTELNPEVSRPISDVIEKGMSISLDQRISNAREMQKLLRDAYAQMQNAMSAQTVAFNLKTDVKNIKEIAQPEIAPPVSERLDQFATIVNENSLPTPVLATQNSNPLVGDKTEQMDFAELKAAINNSASDNEISDDASEPKQSDVKTEVFLAGSGILPSAESELNETSFSANDLKTNNSGAETVAPVISPEQNDGNSIPSEVDSNFDSVQISGESAEEGFNFSPSEDFSGVGAVYADSQYKSDDADHTQLNYDLSEDDHAENVVEQSSQMPPPKKSGGKGLFIAGGLFLLLFLIVGAAGTGWYLYNDSNTSADDSETIPEATPSALPTPEPTADIAITEENTNTDEILTTDANTVDTNEQIKTDPVENNNPPTGTPVRPTTGNPSKTPNNYPTKVPTKPPTGNPAKTPSNPTKQPTPKKDDRTVPLP